MDTFPEGNISKVHEDAPTLLFVPNLSSFNTLVATINETWLKQNWEIFLLFKSRRIVVIKNRIKEDE